MAGVWLLAQEESMWHVRDLHLATTSTSISGYARHFISVAASRTTVAAALAAAKRNIRPS